MIIYRIILILLSPAILAHLFWKSFQIHSLRYLKQRLAFGIHSSVENPVWFHCASVGEANAVLPLVHNLHEQNSRLHFIITTNTQTGASIIVRQKNSYIQHLYLPLDWVNTTRRFIKKIQPVALFIIETELWPNLINECHRSHISVNIINARLTKKTTDTNDWVASLYRQTLSKVDHIYARSDVDKSHFIKLGADPGKTSVVGNLKYALYNRNLRQQDLTKRPYVIAASTHDNEEFQIARSWLQLNRKELLVIAPRHPDRKKHIIQQLQPLTHQIIARTDNTDITDDTRILILDTIGELVRWFVSAEVVIIGGSFVKRGGQNVIEPAQLGKAILFGPHMENFLFESQLLLEHDAAIQVSSTDELAITLTIVLDNEITRTQLETNALKTVEPFEIILSNYTDIVSEIL